MSKNKNKIEKIESIETEASVSSNSQTTTGRRSVLSSWIDYLKSHALVTIIICFLTLGILGSGLKYLDDDAQRELAKRANNKGRSDSSPEESFLNKINPFLPAAIPATTPQLSKEYIYAGSRLLAVEDANASAAPIGDFVVWRESAGDWYVKRGSDGAESAYHWGTTGDIETPGDFDGDGKLDFAIWRPSTTASNSYFWVHRSSNDSYFTAPLGSYGDKPVVADYDGDGISDMATFTPNTAMWWIYLSGSTSWYTPQWGLNGDIPVPADYTGDGKAEVAVWRPSDKQFYILTSPSTYQTVPFSSALGVGGASNEPVVADYDGDGKVDCAVRKTGTADWLIQQSSNSSQIVTVTWQQSTDKPVPGDYDGDGKADVAVWRESNGTWYVSKSGAGGALLSMQWGMTGDKPIQAYYRK